MATAQASSILDQLAEAGKAFKHDEPGSREALIANSRALVAALEIPSEFIQRTFWVVGNELMSTMKHRAL
jgi:hypothetical protein